jgi:universal stress protein E
MTALAMTQGETMASDDILVVLDDDPAAAGVLLGKAAILASAMNARVHAVRIVYEGIADLSASAIDGTAALKSFILQSEETVTESLVEPLRRELPDLYTATLWNARRWEGILHAAERFNAQLIIKAADQGGALGALIRTPDDWNLLRGSSVPVLLVKPQRWVDAPVVLCALDALETRHVALSQAVLRQGAALAAALGGELHLVVAFPLFERFVGELGGLRDYEALRREVDEEIRARVVALAAQAGVDYRWLHADEGRVEYVVADLANKLAAEVVVVGTHARQGLEGFLIGNTAEQLVHHLATDIMTVHAPDAN